jgi:hypothetical protein
MGMDTEEMYRRGVADAAQGEPHPFYYQHYYQYRRGYDRARRSRGLVGGYDDMSRRWRLRLIAAALALLVVAGAILALRWRSQPSATAPSRTALPALAAATLRPTRTPIFPTPAPTPTATPAALRIGGMAQVVNIKGTVLRGRKQPSLKAAATAAFRDGERVRILDGPADADGFTWWKVEGKAGTGWSAQQSKEGMVWLQPVVDQ